MFPDHAKVEYVKSGGNGGMGSEDIIGARGMLGFFEAETVIRHQHSNSLDSQECGVAFVHVIDGGTEAQRLERAQAADAQHDLLLDALVIVAAVELIGDLAMF